MAARRSQQADQLKEERKSEILYAALKLFASKGYHATGVKDIAAEVGITHGTIYLYFKTKEDLLLAVLRTGFARMTRLLQEILGDTRVPPMQRLRTLLHLWMNPTKDDAYFLRVATQVYGLELGDQPPFKGLNLEVQRNVQDLMQPIIRQAQAEGDMHPGDAFTLATIMIGIMAGYVVLYGDGTDAPLTSHADLFLKLLEASASSARGA
jgi:AcrR family transcriptional regulator